MLELITVFTPTYNRAELLRRGYEALKRQTSKNFLWMIVDDGSDDHTKEMAESFQKEENGFRILYFYQKNGGLHTGYNTAIAHGETELMVCIDSDDYMPDDAIEKMERFWKKNGSDQYAGIVGLDYTLNNQRIGDPLPDQKSINLIDLLVGKYKIKNGDRTNVVRTELYRKYAPMKVFEGEKNFNPHYLHLQISQEYDFLVLNENLRFVEYQTGGMSDSMLKQYASSPNSFLETRKLYLSFKHTSAMFKFRHSIHYVSSSILAGKFERIFKDSNHKIYTMLAILPGILLSRYVKSKGSRK